MFHEPVLVDEVLEFLGPAGGTVVDATCGGGGHARAILGRPGTGRLLGLDLDAEAIASAQRYLGSGSGNLVLRQASYVDMVAIVSSLRLAPVTGVLFDFGVSSHQVRTPGRGFSYDLDGPLDMRFDAEGRGPTARELVRRATTEELRRWLREFGEEPRAGRLARLIHERRDRIETTGDLAAVVKRVVPFRQARRTLARVFQALRIVTNDELAAVSRGLAAALEVLAPGGRLVTIGYHSLEDRICKHFIREGAAAGRVRMLARRAVRPSEAEIERNRAARSARLRAAEKLL
ncbi:MAG: 16S rRNA (cytosine(1402)-N(4))-methyltransferase RsmH [bacterium]